MECIIQNIGNSEYGSLAKFKKDFQSFYQVYRQAHCFIFLAFACCNKLRVQIFKSFQSNTKHIFCHELTCYNYLSIVDVRDHGEYHSLVTLFRLMSGHSCFWTKVLALKYVLKCHTTLWDIFCWSRDQLVTILNSK